ncbi:hypothetical protein PRIPAC_73117 [Pristionchus pacificus]|uniref:Uncharacterized protein n=1 Tax=Pristionchus pacificus TaxID=54126 RepID=A0A2A6C8C3_PRIPA|nr:hypothetical protein PRIPAC_73117 [Pristionchus pacificus]|eukprot:PDM74303.1 hypothetical protein PRIPAC_41659 [Pristionchus pacificus]
MFLFLISPILAMLLNRSLLIFLICAFAAAATTKLCNRYRDDCCILTDVPDWATASFAEKDEHIRCAAKYNHTHYHGTLTILWIDLFLFLIYFLFICKVDPEISEAEENRLMDKAYEHGRDYPACFINSNKSGKTWVYLSAETNTIRNTGGYLLKSAEYHCFLDNCNEKFTAQELDAECTRRLIADGTIDPNTIAEHEERMRPTTRRTTTTTLEPLPKPRGMDEYNEWYDRMKAEEEYDD